MGRVSAAWKRAYRRRALPGYPWDGRFESVDQVEEYLGGDLIRCLLCGKMYRSVGLHLSIHEITVDEYKLRYNIPYKYGLECDETRQLHSQGVERRGGIEKIIGEYFRKGLPAIRRRKPCDMILQGWRKRLETVNATSERQKICSQCGRQTTRKGAAALKDHCVCGSCRYRSKQMTEEARQKLNEWATQNKDRSEEYTKAKNWWGWQRKPVPLLRYAGRWGARLRILPKLIESAKAEGLTDSEINTLLFPPASEIRHPRGGNDDEPTDLQSRGLQQAGSAAQPQEP